jgi:hypothetical protein
MAEGVCLQLWKMQREYLIDPDDVGGKSLVARCEQDDCSILLNSPPSRGDRTPVGGTQGVPR